MKKRIMIVDDDNINIKTCNFALMQHGYDVVAKTSGVHCLEYLQNENSPKVDLILLDIEMPIMNGIRTLEHIREIEAVKDIPVMFLTSTATQDIVLKAKNLGAISYLKKPFLPKEMLDRVSKYFAEHSSNDKNNRENENNGKD